MPDNNDVVNLDADLAAADSLRKLDALKLFLAPGTDRIQFLQTRGLWRADPQTIVAYAKKQGYPI
ncbi:MAG: hypothetical protein JO198_12620 [Candidatus Dormibacteraeota bacterium]|nr:hypothetical protein [Candidatus Dormibacteraeota bacterium]